MITLGDKVRCKITGFEGIATTRTEFINGCVQYGITPKIKKGEKYPESVEVDEQQVEVISKKKKDVKKRKTGGSPRLARSMKGF